MVLGSSFSYFCLSLYPECVLWSSFALPFLSSRCLPSSSALSSASSSAVPWVTTDWQCVHWWVIPVVLDRAHEATSTLTSRIATVYKCCGYLQARSWLLLLLFLPQIWSGNLVLSTCSQHHNPHTYTPTHTHTKTQPHTHTHKTTHMCAHTHTHTHTELNTYTHTHAQTWTHTQRQTSTHSRTLAETHTHSVNRCTLTKVMSHHMQLLSVHVRVCVCVYVRVSVCLVYMIVLTWRVRE